jgi:hypothetical protein
MLMAATTSLGSFGSTSLRAQSGVPLPATVQFPSADGKTTLVAFVYTPRDNAPSARQRW